MYSRPDRVVRFFTVDISYLVRFGTDPDLFHSMIQDVVHPGFPTADSDVRSFSRGRTGDPNLRRRRLAEEIRLVAQRNRDVAGSIRSRPRIRRFRLLRRNAIPDGMRIHEIWAIRGSIRFEEDPRKKAKARFGFDRVGRNDRTELSLEL